MSLQPDLALPSHGIQGESAELCRTGDQPWSREQVPTETLMSQILTTLNAPQHGFLTQGGQGPGVLLQASHKDHLMVLRGVRYWSLFRLGDQGLPGVVASAMNEQGHPC